MPTNRNKSSTTTTGSRGDGTTGSRATGTGSIIAGPFQVKPSSGSSGNGRSARQPQRSARRPLDDDDDGELCVESLEPPRRKYDCRNYDGCLDLAAALNWDSFTCGDCCGQVDEALYWRAHQVRRKDSVARALCELPPILSLAGASINEDVGTPIPTAAGLSSAGSVASATSSPIGTGTCLPVATAQSASHIINKVASNGGELNPGDSSAQHSSESPMDAQPANADDPSSR